MKLIRDYDHKTGLVLEFDTSVDAAFVIRHLKLPVSKIGMVTVNGRIAAPDDMLPDNAVVKIFQPVFGG